MRTSYLHRVLSLLAMIVMVNAPVPALAASAELFGGDFGRWLSDEALPELSTLVGKHPRFRGEQIRVVAMEGGRPALGDNELSVAVRNQLTHRLTRIKDVQIAWQTTAVRCGVQRQTPYLLGVEISGESRSRSRVTIALVDVEEGIWISGGYLQWQGVLTQQERRALAQSVTAAPTGSIERPLPDARHEEITAVLVENIECALRGGLDGSVRIVAADPQDGMLNDVAALVREALTRSARLTVVDRFESVPPQDDAQESRQKVTRKGPPKELADWVLELRVSRDVGEAVVATLRAIDSVDERSVNQRLAAVYVYRSGQARLASDQPPKRRTNSATKPGSVYAAHNAALIDELHEVPSKVGDPCYRRSANCLEVQFELAAPSYLLVLRTQPGGSLNLGRCSGPRKTTGTKRYRLQMRQAGAGFYALATTDLALARRLHRQLAAGASNCGDRSHSDWLAQFEMTLAGAEKHLDWRAYHIPARLRDDLQQPEALAANRRSPRAGFELSAEFSKENTP